MAVGEIGQVGLLVGLHVVAGQLPKQGNAIAHVQHTVEVNALDTLPKLHPATLILAPVS